MYNKLNVPKWLQDHNALLIKMSLFNITVGDVRGKAELKESFCLDLSLPGFEQVSQSGCVLNSEAWDFDEMGSYLNATFIASTGTSCTCDEAGCNDIRGKYNLFICHVFCINP